MSPPAPVRVAYLGPAGTFSEQALLRASAGTPFAPVLCPTVGEAVMSVASGRADRALVPFENAIEGSVRATLDALAFDAPSLELVGEYDLAIRHSLIAAAPMELEEVREVFSHPQASAQCSRFIREQLPHARIQAAPSTAEAVRTVSERRGTRAALGPAEAAERYGAVELRRGVEDSEDNVTRFVWVAPPGTRPRGEGPWRSALMISELADHPGALVELLSEFARREVNLTRIESRPLRRGLGRYLFFLDVEGSIADPPVAEAVQALRDKAETVRVMGSFPVGAPGIPGL